MIKKIRKTLLLTIALIALIQTTIFQTTLQAAESKNNVYTINTAVSDTSTTRKFMITNLTSDTISGIYYTSIDQNNPINITVQANATQAIVVHVGTAGSVLLFTNIDEIYSTVNSFDGYNLPVNYYALGNIIATTNVTALMEGGAVWTAPAETTINGINYAIQGNNYKSVTFGATEIAFQYKAVVKTPYKSYINYVDETGTRLNAEKTISFMVGETGGTFTPQSTYIAPNGNSYSLLSGQRDVTQSYADGSQTFTYRYQKNDVAKPYLITVIYKNTAGNVLGTKTLSVSKTQGTSFKTADTLVDGNGIQYARANGEATEINHEYTNSNRTYTVVYDVVQATSPYDISIQAVDLLTGKTLSTTKKNVGIDKTVRYHADASIEKGNTTYVLSKDQTADITHTFGGNQRVYTIYYNEKDKDVTSYKISIMYFDVTNNKVLSHTQQDVALGSNTTISVPTSYNANTTEFVLLSGQGDATHSFYSTRRSYVFFYRDIKDTANEDTVVETTPDGGLNVINPNARNPIIDVDQDGTITIPNGGENGEDLVVDEDDNVVVKDNVTPKGKGTTSRSDNQVYYIAGASGVLIALFILLMFLKKRKAENNTVE